MVKPNCLRIHDEDSIDPVKDLAMELVDKLIDEGKLNPRMRQFAIDEMEKELSNSCKRFASRVGRNLDTVLNTRFYLMRKLGLRVVG